MRRPRFIVDQNGFLRNAPHREIGGPIDLNSCNGFLTYYALDLCALWRFSPFVRYRRIGELQVRCNTSGIPELHLRGVGSLPCAEPDDRSRPIAVVAMNPRTKFGPTNIQYGRRMDWMHRTIDM